MLYIPFKRYLSHSRSLSVCLSFCFYYSGSTSKKGNVFNSSLHPLPLLLKTLPIADTWSVFVWWTNKKGGLWIEPLLLRVSGSREAIKSFTQGSDVIRTAFGSLHWFNFIILEGMVFNFEAIICRRWLIPVCKSQLVNLEEFCSPFVKHNHY